MPTKQFLTAEPTLHPEEHFLAQFVAMRWAVSGPEAERAAQSLYEDAALPVTEGNATLVSGEPRSKSTACSGDTSVGFWTVQNHSCFEFCGQLSLGSRRGQGKAGDDGAIGWVCSRLPVSKQCATSRRSAASYI